jgi:transposase InsO family protein
MPWPEVSSMEQRRELMSRVMGGRFSKLELAREAGVSRKTLYKWLERFCESGDVGMADRSHARHTQYHGVSELVEKRLLDLKKKHRYWGPRKLKSYLEGTDTGVVWPAASTIGALLKRHGLVKPRRPASPSMPASPWCEAQQSNDVWAIDFKGQFRLADGQYCYPLTLSDSYSRYLLSCEGLGSIHGDGVRRVLERVFQERGLPAAIRSDNGSPFATYTGSLGLTALSVWWLRLGIQLQRIKPGKPQQNGRHERMHRTLKEATVHPAAASFRAQQRRFDGFKREYNEERPHESLGDRRPKDFYQPSTRSYPKNLPEPIYPKHFELRTVNKTGEFRWEGTKLFLSAALRGEQIGLEQIPKGWRLHFADTLIGVVDDETKTLIRVR